MKAFQQIFECQLYGKNLAFWDAVAGNPRVSFVFVEFPAT